MRHHKNNGAAGAAGAGAAGAGAAGANGATGAAGGQDGAVSNSCPVCVFRRCLNVLDRAARVQVQVQVQALTVLQAPVEQLEQ